jgi:hypothetical protein
MSQSYNVDDWVLAIRFKEFSVIGCIQHISFKGLHGQLHHMKNMLIIGGELALRITFGVKDCSVKSLNV